MEEIKIKKKLNKKPLIICLVLALVFGIVGFVDIKSNAAELKDYGYVYHAEEFGRINEAYNDDGTLRYIQDYYNDYNGVVYVSNSPFKYYMWNCCPNKYGYGGYGVAFVCESNQLGFINQDNGSYSSLSVKSFNCNGKTMYYFYVRDVGYSYWNVKLYARNEDLAQLLATDYATENDFIQAYINDSLDVKIDYDNLPIDDDMLVPSNLKRNVILNDTNISTGLYMDTYDLVTWNNTSEDYLIELQRCPVVQIYKTPLFGSNEFIKEFVGEWKTEQVFEEITNEYLKRTDIKGLLDEDADTLIFKGNLTYDLNGLEQDYIYFGYRIRYVDLENNVASPWLVLMPTHSKDNYETFLEYCDSSQGDKTDGNGVVNEYKDLEDLNGAIDDVKTENNFKDKYEIVDGNADTQEVMNWLNTVVSFIKGTPNIVTSVLSFLPQPILYGMYITIFLGCIASAIAIVKALI